MELSISGNSLKTFTRSITCLARVGNELAIQASSTQLAFHTLNSSRSAYQSIIFKSDFFDVFTVSVAGQVQCSVLLKAVCSVLRTPVSGVDRLHIVLADPDASKLQWTLHCLSGIKKTYWITCNIEPDVQQLSLDRRKLPSSLVVRPRDFNRLLANFQSSLQEITVIATEQSSVPPDVSNEIGGKAIELRSYIDPTKEDNDTALHTQLWIDPSEEFLQYNHTGDPVDVTFGVKELKAFLSFCEACEVDIHLYFEKAGEPILMAPKFGLDDMSTSDFDVTLVLATMLVSQINEANNISENQAAAATTAPGQVDGDIVSYAQGGSRTAASEHNSDHTKIWSELTGSAVRSGSGTGGRSAEVKENANASGQREMPPINTMGGSNNGCAREAMPDIHHPMEVDCTKEHQACEEVNVHGWSQHHPSNWVGEAEDDDDEDESELCVQSTPQY